MHTSLVPEPIRLTYQDYCALPEDGRRYEILDGDLYRSPSPEIPHQTIVLNLAAVLREHVREQKLGRVFVAPLDVILDEHNIVEPDIIYVSKAKQGIISQKNIQGSPDLLIEVLSPGSRDLRDKRNIYARCGVPFYWIVDPEAGTLHELQLVETAYATVALHVKGTAFQSVLFPDLRIELNALWE